MPPKERRGASPQQVFMKRIRFFKQVFVAITLLMVFWGNVNAQCSITMNSISRTMTLTPKVGDAPVAVGTPTAYTYNFDVAPGDYVLSAYDASNNLNGTIELTITDEADQSFDIVTVTSGATNAGWVLGTDYTMDYRAVGKEGVIRTIAAGTGTTDNRITFLMLVGDSYFVNILPSAAHTALVDGERYMKTGLFGTVTASSVTAQGAAMQGSVFEVTVPKEATLFVGEKGGAVAQGSGGVHYVPFYAKEPVDSTFTGDKKTYQYLLGTGNNINYNYRVSQPGKITNAGKFTRNTAMPALEITAEMLNAATPDSIDHVTAHNEGANVADILMNINAQGHLKLNQGAVRSVLALRSWQLTDNSTNNYFIEPDFHYSVVNENGQPDNSVITIDDKGLITAVGAGNAIVQITYDAISLLQHNYVSYTEPQPFYYGGFWSAIWPENVGTFVVTVGGNDDASIVPNMFAQGELRTNENTSILDAEHDIFYYLEGTAGYSYSFKPDGVATVSVANPILGKNSASYTGFTPVTANEDGSYTMLLTYGRNIIKMTAANGASKYQIITAKPVGYDSVVNKSRPGEPILPGDDVDIQFHGFFHPANKLAGIYNMSAYIQYDGKANGSSLILSANQYQFCGKPEAQLVTAHIPGSWNTKIDGEFSLTHGAMMLVGYGSVIGKHRAISTIAGVSPNFTASVRQQYFGAIPDIPIPLATPTEGFYFTGVPEGAKIVVINAKNDTLKTNSQGQYLVAPNDYTYKISLDTYKTVWEAFTLVQGDGVVAIPVQMQLSDASIWDGTTLTAPQQVTADESNTTGGVFEGMLDYYKLSTGAELAWFANAVNTGSNTVNGVVANDIDLANFDWTRIGNNTAAYQYKGVFDGGNYTIDGLYINNTTAYQGLFGYINGATVRNLTVKGHVTSIPTAAASYTGGIIGYSAGASTITNCHNQVTVSGKQYTGGVLGYAASAALTITDCSNSANIASTTTYVGGIAGSVLGTTAKLERLSNSGNITSTGNYVGGLFGAALVNITDACNTGNVNGGASYVGGITGNSGTADKTITNVYNTGSVKSGTGSVITWNAATAISNAYTLEGAGATDANVTEKTSAEFASGKVAWLLGNSFGQTIGTNASPVLNGDKVYKILYTNNLDNETDNLYTNGTLPEIKKDGYVGSWYTEENGTLVTEVNENSTLYLLFDVTTNIDLFNSDKISVYPNPFTDYIIINAVEDGNAVLYNLSGKVVLSTSVKSGNNRISTTTLPKGVYVLKNGSAVVKIIK
jgi:hypothetical protein